MHKLLALICLSCFSLSAIAQKTAAIYGKVKDKDNKERLANIPLELFLNKQLIASTTSNKNGEYDFKNLEAGNYQLKVNANGYKLWSRSIELKVAEVKRRSVYLRSIRPTPPPPPPPPVEIVEVEEEIEINVDGAIAPNKELFYAAPKRRLKSARLGAAPRPHRDVIQPSINHNREDYKKNAENEFITVTDEALSTFSIDVDRASYSNVRRFINNGQLPAAGSVRIEEMINYFDYKYQGPKDDTPFAIHPELSGCPWNKNAQLLRVALQGKKMDLSKAPNSNLVFLLDVSGSMNSANKLPLLKSSLKLLVNNLRPEDRVAIVVYAGAAGLVLPSTPASQKNKIIDALDKLSAGGSTAGGAGIKLAYKVAKDNFIKNGNNRVLLATDGDFNVGTSSHAGLEELIEEKRKDDVFLTVLGFGTGNYQDSRAELLADKGNGNYSYIDNIREAQKTLVKEIGGTLFTIAKDVKIQIEFNPTQVAAYRLIGYENRLLNKEDFNDDKKDAGELGAGHTVTALYEIILKKDAKAAGITSSIDASRYQQNTQSNGKHAKEWMNIKLRYKAPTGTKSKLIEYPLTGKDLKSFDKVSTNTQFATAVAGFGMLLTDSKFKGDLDYTKVITWAKRNKGKDDDGYRAEFIRLVETVNLMQESAKK